MKARCQEPSSALEQYLERQYSDFEQSHLQGEHFWGAPVSALKNTRLFSLFEQFRALFPDHPDEDNTLFYILRGPRSGGYTARLVCLHFEHTSLQDIRNLADFLERTASAVGHQSNILIDYLGGETLIVNFCEVAEPMVNLIRKHATRAAA